MDNPVFDIVLEKNQGAAMVEVIVTSKKTKVFILKLIPKIALID